MTSLNFTLILAIAFLASFTSGALLVQHFGGTYVL